MQISNRHSILTLGVCLVLDGRLQGSNKDEFSLEQLRPSNKGKLRSRASNLRIQCVRSETGRRHAPPPRTVLLGQTQGVLRLWPKFSSSRPHSLYIRSLTE